MLIKLSILFYMKLGKINTTLIIQNSINTVSTRIIKFLL